MTMPSPATAATNWANGMSNATAKITAGVNAVSVAPTQLAAQAANRMLAGIQAAVSSGKWQARLQAVTLQDWQQAMLNKGVPRVASGAQAAKPKFQTFLQQFLPYLQTGVQQMNAQQPRGDLEANIARATFMMRYNASFKQTGG